MGFRPVDLQVIEFLCGARAGREPCRGCVYFPYFSLEWTEQLEKILVWGMRDAWNPHDGCKKSYAGRMEPARWSRVLNMVGGDSSTRARNGPHISCTRPYAGRVDFHAGRVTSCTSKFEIFLKTWFLAKMIPAKSRFQKHNKRFGSKVRIKLRFFQKWTFWKQKKTFSKSFYSVYKRQKHNASQKCPSLMSLARRLETSL